jgi:malate dehydrogenase
MFLALNENVSELVVQDLTVAMVPPEGVAADLSHIETKCKVSSFAMDPSKPPVEQLECLTGCHLVVVPAGVPRKPGMTRDDLLGINASIARGIAEACAKYCPDAILALIVNPVNSIVPCVAELYKGKGLDASKVLGITTLDVVRANKFVGSELGVNPSDVDIPVIGGHAGVTIMPVFSQDKHGAKLTADQVAALDKRTQDAGTEVVTAKNGKGSATLSMAYAGSRLCKAVLSGLAGTPATECAYLGVGPEVAEGTPYFATKVTFGPKGVEKIHPIGELTEYEKGRLASEVIPALTTEIASGVKYATENPL